MSLVAVIPARGGSKRIPGKNIRLFYGKPVISYAINECFKSNLFSRIIVSTDDHLIAEVAENCGAEVFLRMDKNNSTDDAPVILAVKEVIASLDLVKNCDAMCCVFPCTPLLKSETLIDGYKILQEKEVDFVFPVFSPGLPIQRSLFVNSEGFIEMQNKDFISAGTNCLKEEHLFDAGQYYWAKTITWTKSSSILGGRNRPHLIDRLSIVDIDNEDDWQLAELLFGQRLKGDKGV